MQFGVCGTGELVEAAALAGYDFFEWTVGGFLKPREPDEAFRRTLDEVRALPLPCAALNVFLPPDLKVVGPAVDAGALDRYVRTAMRRAQEARIAVVVFGSGGARRIPAGFDRAAAWAQLMAFCRALGPVAQEHGVTIAVEPLNRGECNVLNSVAECAQLVREAGHPAIRLLVDGFHWLKDDNDADAIAANGTLLAHAHVGTVPKRMAPGLEPCDLPRFFGALRQAGYTGRLCVEAQVPEPRRDLPAALALMRSLAG